MTPVAKALIILSLCPLLGGLPLITWISRGLARKDLRQLGTGNVSVAAAFYHAGTTVGVLAVLSEMLKGILAVLLAQSLFPDTPAWQVIALVALVLGRYGWGGGAGTTNVVWGFVVYDPITSGLVALIGGVGFTLVRDRLWGKFGVLALLPLITVLRHPYDNFRQVAVLLLSLVMAWIYYRIPDDLSLSANAAEEDSRKVFRFFRGDRAILSLDQRLDPEQVGHKAATLAQLKQWGYPVPMGWVLPPGDDPAPLVESLHPDPEHPLIARSSAIGEDSEVASAAGLYTSVPHLTSQSALAQAVLRCQSSYNLATAAQYRQERGIREGGMAVLVQRQVQGVFSGVAFSRDPIRREGEAVVIEALPGTASQIVSGRVTPQQYRILVTDQDMASASSQQDGPAWQLPETLELPVDGQGDVPPRLIQQVAYLARLLEDCYHGVPQDIEWSYDGQQVWVLQSRPITTLVPIWTRKIAAEVIPGFIRPLTWSINRPLTCGVWGDIFTLVLGDRARGLDFTETATLHHSAAYFNATLLNQIFLRMGLPPESLEFLTRGAKFSKPPLASTLRNVPGLLRLLGRELNLEQDFAQDYQNHFAPTLAELAQTPAAQLPPSRLLSRIEQILIDLRKATYYSILAPLSLSLRRAMFNVAETELDTSKTPEVASMRSLRSLALASRPLIPHLQDLCPQSSTIFAEISETEDGQSVLHQLDQFLVEYGYLSDVATDIAVPTWREDPHPVREMFTQFLCQKDAEAGSPPTSSTSWKAQMVQPRMTLKGQVTEVYNRLLAELRWSFVALEQQWLAEGWLAEAGDVFFLTLEEIRQVISDEQAELKSLLPDRIADRKAQFESDRQLTPPTLVYGNDPPRWQASDRFRTVTSGNQMRGIGASAGRVEGTVRVVTTLTAQPDINRSTILVVPYTDSGWSPLLARAGAVIAEVGGRLSHGAIIAREYGIPAVMDIPNATQVFRNGQTVRVDGETGTIDIL
jgi:pyruvate,water dikinase